MSWLLSNFLTLVFVGMVLLGLVFIFNKNAGGTVLTVISASTGAFGRWLRSKFPAYILQHEITKESNKIENLWKAMEEKKAIIEGLKEKVPDKQREVNRLQKIIEQALRNEDDQTARSEKIEQKRITAELERDSENLIRHQNEYNVLKDKLSRHEDNVVNIKKEAKATVVDLNTARADAAIAKKLGKLNELDETGLGAANEALNDALIKARAVTAVANERNEKENNRLKYERKAMEDEVDQELKELKEKLKSGS